MLSLDIAHTNTHTHTPVAAPNPTRIAPQICQTTGRAAAGAPAAAPLARPAPADSESIPRVCDELDASSSNEGRYKTKCSEKIAHFREEKATTAQHIADTSSTHINVCIFLQQFKTND
jgi:hypothetical protein